MANRQFKMEEREAHRSMSVPSVTSCFFKNKKVKIKIEQPP